jgi:hypothetical protein
MNRISSIRELCIGIRSRCPEWAVISAFTAIVGYIIPYHEAWADEAQAWQLAQSLSLRELFKTYIRYEASPGLWHLLLWILIRLHVSYNGLHWICGAIAVVSTSLFVLKSPFPLYLRMAFPFTYFLLYQYAVVARSYILVPIMLYMVALLWKRNPVWLTILLGLLANISLHAAVISGGLAVVYLFERVQNADARKHGLSRKLLFCAPMLLCFYVFAIWTSWPPRDLVISVFRKQSRPLFTYALVSLVGGMCEPWVLSILFWIVIALCLHGRRKLYFLLPVLLFAVFSGAVYVEFHHMGLLVPLVLCILWITWPEPGYIATRYEMLGLAALMVMAVTQILWSGYAIQFDRFEAYSPGLATAQFLKPFVQNGDIIVVTYLGHPAGLACDNIAILPYFARNIFANQQNSFWWWSDKDHTENRYLEILPSRPRIVVVEARRTAIEEFDMHDAKISVLLNSGYKFTNIFCGSIPVRLELGLTNCNLIFQR